MRIKLLRLNETLLDIIGHLTSYFDIFPINGFYKFHNWYKRKYGIKRTVWGIYILLDRLEVTEDACDRFPWYDC